MTNITKVIMAPNAHTYIEQTKLGNCIFIKEICERKLGRRTAIFQCICGKEFIAPIAVVKSGIKKGCGCRIYAKKPIEGSRLRHGYARKGKEHSEYTTWLNMKARCYNPNEKRYIDYGGRGIIVCNRWLESFENFIGDMGDKPAQNFTIERRNYNGNYEPKNCYWLPKDQQSRNKRDNHWIEYEGVNRLLIDWAKDLGVKGSVISRRLKRGWSIKDALITPSLIKPYKIRK
jgi:hypothetical protein